MRLLGVHEVSAQAPAGRPAAQQTAQPQQITNPTVRPATPGAKSGGISATARPAPAAAPAQAAASPPPGGVPATPRPDPSTLQVMAVVNSEQITRTDLGRECIRRYGEEVLESMVNRVLIAESCAKQGIQITEADVSAEIDKIASRFGLSRDRWLTLLRDERGFSEAQYRNEVVWPMIALRHIAAAQIDVTPEELRKAFDSEFGPKVKARLIATDNQQKAAEARQAAAAAPAQFGEVSKKYSSDPGVASAYGVIPPIRKNLGDANLEKVAFSLQPGQISPVVNVANMYYVILCEEHLPQQHLTSQQMAEQQGRLKEKIKENKLRVAAGEFFDKVHKQAQIVNVFNNAELSKKMPGVAATVNGRQIPLENLAAECITRHGQEVLDGEINRKILQQELSRKRVVVEQADIDAEIVRAADSYGYHAADGKPDVNKWLKSVTEVPGATVDLYVRDAVWPSCALKKLVGTKVEVTDEDLKRGFESNYGERVEVQAIVLSDHRQAQKVWEQARNNLSESFFGELAQQYSIEPSSRSNKGKVPPIRRHSGSPLLEEEAFKCKAGDISGIIAVDDQFIILRCQGRTRPIQVDFNSVKGELHKDILEKKMRALMTREFDRLKDVAQVDNFLAGTSQSGGARPASSMLLPQSPAAASAQRTTPAATATPRPTASAAPATAAQPRPATKSR
jgi:parvulin-like peptidyl-prolyl isomerase